MIYYFIVFISPKSNGFLVSFSWVPEGSIINDRKLAVTVARNTEKRKSICQNCHGNIFIFSSLFPPFLNHHNQL